MLPGLKITLAAMAVTVATILAILAGFGANRGSNVPILSAAAVPRPSAPLTLVDNPQEEARMRQRVARRSDEVTRLLALPNGPVFALGHETGEGAETGLLRFVPPAVRPLPERPLTADFPIPSQVAPAAPRAETESRVAALAEGATSAAAPPAHPAIPAALAPCDGPRTPIAPQAYFQALRAAAAKPNAQVASAPNTVMADTQSDAASAPPATQAAKPDATVAAPAPPIPLREAAPLPHPRAKPARLAARAPARQAAKAEQAEAEKAKAEKTKFEKTRAEKAMRAKRAAASRKKLLARRARAAATAAAAKPTAPVQTDWFGQPVRAGAR